MATGVLLTPPILNFLDNTGQPAANGSVLFTVGAVNTPVYADAGLTIPLQNPVPLNSRGELATSTGVSTEVFLTPNTVYAATLFDKNSNQLWSATYINGVQLVLTAANVGAALYPITPAETAAAATPINYQYPSGVVDRYGINTLPGTTDMSAAFQTAINVALVASTITGSGVPVRFGYGAYSIVTPPTFGLSILPLLPLDIGGQGLATQLINNATVSTAALLDMGGHSGWYIHDLLITGNSIHKNDGIHAGKTGSAQQQWRIERVTAFMAGVGFYVSDTNGGVINQCRSWLNDPPPFPVPQLVTTSDVGHHFYLTGGFINNISLYDCVGLPSHNFFGGTNLQRGIKMDCASSFGVNIIGGDFETYQGGVPYEIGIDIIPSGSCQSMNLSGVYYEGTTIQVANIVNCTIGPLADGNVPNSNFTLGAACRNNTLMGITAANINDSNVQNYGNTFIACNARTTWTDVSTGPVDRRISCLAAGVVIRDWGGKDPSNVSIPNTGVTQVVDLYTNDYYRFVLVGTSTAFTIQAPLHTYPGAEFTIVLANTSGGVGPGVTFAVGYHMTSNTPANPANGFELTYKFKYNGSNSQLQATPPATVPV